MNDLNFKIEEQLSRFPLKSVRYGGSQFSYRETGTGEAVLLLHGIGSLSDSWLKVFQRWNGSARLIALDTPGYGTSSALDMSTPRASDYGEAVDAFANALGLKVERIVGHSLGALIAMAYANRGSNNLKNLMLLDPARGYSYEPEQERTKRIDARRDLVDRLGPEGLSRERGAKLLSENPTAESLALVRWSMSRIRPAGYIQAVRMLVNSDILDDASICKTPTVVACGEADSVTPPDLAKSIAEAMENSTFKLISNAGHASYVEQPILANNLLNEWMEV